MSAKSGGNGGTMVVFVIILRPVCAAKSTDSDTALVLFLIKLCPHVRLTPLASVYDCAICVCAAIQWQWEYTGIVWIKNILFVC